MSDGNGALPEGWASSTIEEVCQKVTDGTHFTPKFVAEGIPFITVRHVQDGIIEFDSADRIPRETYDELCGTYQPLKGDVLFSKDGTVGKVHLVEDPPEYIVLSSLAILRPESQLLDSRFLAHAMKSPSVIAEATDRKSGTAIRRIILRNLRKVSVRVPPLGEQRRIVSKIESLQERSSRARRALSEVGPLLEQFRQSVLRAAFSGRLTADWRAAHRDVEPATELLSRIRTERRHRWEQSELAKYEAKGKQPPKNWQGKYKEPQPLSNDELAELPSLPDGWCWSRFADFCTVQGGFAFKSKDYTDTGTPLIRIGDLDDGTVTIDDSTARLPPAFAEQHPQFQLNAGDVLIAMSGATTGKMAVFDSNDVALLNQRVGRFLPHAPDLIHGPYLRGLVESIVEDIRSRAYGGAQPNISPTEIAATPVAFPPLDEQVRIANLLSEARVSGSNVESECAESESALTQLDQSILAKAFRGELVPQDPRDEPASELLARIRTTRETSSMPRKAKRKRATSD